MKTTQPQAGRNRVGLYAAGASTLMALSASVALGGGGLVLIRPTGATASSQFNGSYDIGNTIDGSGLPLNFGPADGHATYAVNNHWTTAAGPTVGRSATFTFSTAQTVNRFFMWNHRSNNIASNAWYGVTNFTLTLRDAAGNPLRVLENVPSSTGIASAQTFCFPETAGVRSAVFVINATANNNAGPYTGLAEVAFGQATRCGPADIAGPNQSTCVDGVLTADDIILFLGRYFASNLGADIAGPNQSSNPDGQLTADDIIVFLGLYFQGC
jgi:hypothetical protein